MSCYHDEVCCASLTEEEKCHCTLNCIRQVQDFREGWEVVGWCVEGRRGETEGGMLDFFSC